MKITIPFQSSLTIELTEAAVREAIAMERTNGTALDDTYFSDLPADQQQAILRGWFVDTFGSCSDDYSIIGLANKYPTLIESVRVENLLDA